MTKNAERRERFIKRSADISALKIGDPDVSDYWTGRSSAFVPRGRKVQDDSEHSQYEPCLKPCCKMLVRSEGGINSRLPGAPQTKTLQFERTIRN